MSDKELLEILAKRDQLLRDMAHDAFCAKIAAIAAAILGAASLIIRVVTA